jgi:hypothetical protein
MRVMDVEYGGSIRLPIRRTLELYFASGSCSGSLGDAFPKLLTYRVIDIANWILANKRCKIWEDPADPAAVDIIKLKYNVSSFSFISED